MCIDAAMRSVLLGVVGTPTTSARFDITPLLWLKRNAKKINMDQLFFLRLCHGIGFDV